MSKAVSGTKDFFGAELIKKSRVLKIFESHMQKYSYTPIETPILENSQLYISTSGETSDIVCKELYFVTNKHSPESDIVLRPEGTASVIRSMVNMGRGQEQNLKLYYAAPMFRHNRPQKWRYRQHMQLGCEVLNPSKFITVESIICLATLLKELKISYKMHLNVIPKDIGEFRGEAERFFRANIDKLTEASRTTLEKNPLRVLDQVSQDKNFANTPKPVDFITVEERKDFEWLLHMLQKFSVEYDLNPKLVRGLDYYEGLVFECIVEGMSIAAGGRYRMQGDKFGMKKDVEAFGWGVGLERVLDLAEVAEAKEEVFVLVSLEEDEYALELGCKLRAEGKVCFTCFDGLKKGMQVASRLAGEGFRVNFICVGEDERINGEYKAREWVARDDSLWNNKA